MRNGGNSEELVAIVTGASSGIGRASAIEIAGPGHRLVLVARRQEELEQTASVCRSRGAECLVVPTDLANPGAGREVVDRALESYGRVDVLVNAAGFAILAPLQNAGEDDLRRMIETNYLGTVSCILAVLPSMLERGAGSIVNVGSITGIMGVARMGGYAATKWAIAGFTESLRNDLHGTGVRVSLVCPGTTQSGFFESADRSQIPGADRLVRTLRPEKVARAVARAIRRGNARIIIPWEAALFMRLKEIFPRSAHFLMRTTSSILERKAH